MPSTRRWHAPAPVGGPAPGSRRARRDHFRRARRDYRSAQLAFGVNLAGNGVGAVGFPLFVLDVSGEIELTGWIVAAAAATALLTGVFMGPLIDRIGLRTSWMASVLVGSATTATTVALHLAGVLEPWMLFALTILRSAADEPGRVATFGLLPSLATRAGFPLHRANATLRVMSAVAGILAPVVAGIVVAAGSSAATQVIDVVAGLGAAAVLLFVPTPQRADVDRSDGGVAYLVRFRRAAGFLWADGLLRPLIIAAMLFATLDSGLSSIGLVAYADDALGSPALFGPLVSAFGLGCLVGTIGYAFLGQRMSRRAAFLGAYVGVGVLLLVLTAVGDPVVALLVLFVAGVVISPVDLICVAALQERVPERMFGGVASIATTSIAAPGPLGVVAVTWLVTTGGSRTTFGLLAASYLLIASSLIVSRSLRDLDGDNT